MLLGIRITCETTRKASTRDQRQHDRREKKDSHKESQAKVKQIERDQHHQMIRRKKTGREEARSSLLLRDQKNDNHEKQETDKTDRAKEKIPANNSILN